MRCNENKRTTETEAVVEERGNILEDIISAGEPEHPISHTLSTVRWLSWMPHTGLLK
jgi:hypothetical protein